MDELLSREQLRENLIHNKALEMECKETVRADVKYLIALHKPALYWQDKAERQATEYKSTLEIIVENDKTIYTYYGARARRKDGELPEIGETWLTPADIARAALAAIEGVKNDA